MNKFLFLFTFFCIAQFPLFAQTSSYCGTTSTDMKWLDHYVEHREQFDPEWGVIYNIPIQVHLVAQDNGSKRMTIPNILKTLAKLNSDMEQAELRFFLKSDFDSLDNSTWYDHDYSQGYEMMNSNNINGALNIYAVGSPAGNCGYYAPSTDAIALAIGCSGGTSSTLTHEMGHMLSLPHTFFGCEGVRYDPTEPISTFKSKIRGTLEKVDQSNCSRAADRFCDTDPDYLSYRWNCNRDGRSTVELKDENGSTFRADGGLFMSYSNDGCANRFSEQQIQAMRANINNRRSSIKKTTLPEDIITSNVPGLILPNSQELDPSNALLSWEEAPNATRYYVHVSRRKSFGGKAVYKGVVSKNTLQLPELLPGKKYYIRFYPYNFVSFDAGYSETFSFNTAEISAVNNNGTTGLQLQSNLIKSGESIRLTNSEQVQMKISISDINGHILFKDRIRAGATLILPAHWSAGVYLLSVKKQNDTKSLYFPIVLY